MKLGIIRLYAGKSGKVGYYNIQEIGLAKALAKRGISTDIFFLINKQESKKIIIEEVNEKVRIIYVPANRLCNHGIISPKFILNYKIDIIHLLSDNQIMVPSFIRFCNKNNIPFYSYIGTLQSDTKSRLKNIVMNILSKRNIRYLKNSNVVVKTPAVREQLKNSNVSILDVIPVGLDTEIIPESNMNKFELINELNIESGKKILIFVGRLEEYKEPLKSIELMKELKTVSDGYTLIVIGNGSLKSKMCSLIKEYELEKDVILIDEVENSRIHNFYKASDVFLNFNNHEIFGMSILEAMYQECKVIAKNASGPNYIIDDKINGVIMKDYNASNWIKAIENNIDNEEMSRLAKRKIVEFFNWNSIAEKYINLFEEIKGE